MTAEDRAALRKLAEEVAVDLRLLTEDEQAGLLQGVLRLLDEIERLEAVVQHLEESIEDSIQVYWKPKVAALKAENVELKARIANALL